MEDEGIYLFQISRNKQTNKQPLHMSTCSVVAQSILQYKWPFVHNLWGISCYEILLLMNRFIGLKNQLQGNETIRLELS